jgi:hypothetical protein
MTSVPGTPATLDNDHTQFSHYACIAVVCTNCGAHCGDDDDAFILHFTSIGDALREITTQGWSVSETAVLCTVCAEEADDNPPPLAALRLCEFCSPPLFSTTAPLDGCRCHDQAITHALVPLISRAHPGLERHTCVTIQCNDCDDNLGHGDSAPHFTSEAHARAAASRAEWMVVGQLLTCQPCTNRRACTMLSHSWPEHPTFTRDDIEYRRCLRCDEYLTNHVDSRDMPWL